MKNKFFVAISAILVTGALLLSATAQSNKRSTPEAPNSNLILIPGKLPVATYLQASVWGTDEFPRVIVTNNTNLTVAAGKTVFWAADSTHKGSIVLSKPLTPGQSLDPIGAPGMSMGAKPKAYYFK